GWKIWMKARSVDAMPKSIDHSPPGGGEPAGGTGARSGPAAAEYQLLAADEPPPVFEIGLQGRSNFVIVVDHSRRRIPRRLNDLGLPAAELQRHIAWDIGALEVARQVAAALDAPLVAQNYSRLVIDCNRDPKVPTSIPRMSESTEIPGNLQLSAADIAAGRTQMFEPYHQRIGALLDDG